MGNASCSLSDTDDPCLIANCIERAVPVLKGNLPQDVYVATFKSGTTYKGRPELEAVVRVWSQYTPPALAFRRKALNYELCLRKYVINPLIRTNKAPYFVELYAGRRNCPFSTLESITSKAILPSDPVPARAYALRSVALNEFETRNNLKKTQLFSTPFDPHVYLLDADLAQKAESHQVGLMVEQMGYATLRQLIDDPRVTPEDWMVLFAQVALACGLLHHSKVFHGALTLDVITVEYETKNVVTEVKTDDEVPDRPPLTFKFRSRYVARLGGFGTATALPRLGENPLMAAHGGIPAITNDLLDFAQFFFSIPEAYSSTQWLRLPEPFRYVYQIVESHVTNNLTLFKKRPKSKTLINLQDLMESTAPSLTTLILLLCDNAETSLNGADKATLPADTIVRCLSTDFDARTGRMVAY